MASDLDVLRAQARRIAQATQEMAHESLIAPRPAWEELGDQEQEIAEQIARTHLRAMERAGLIVVDLPPAWRHNLRALLDTDTGLHSLADVLRELADHAQQAVFRPGAWEREWLCQAWGYDWLRRLEPDPERPAIYQRPRAE